MSISSNNLASIEEIVKFQQELLNHQRNQKAIQKETIKLLNALNKNISLMSDRLDQFALKTNMKLNDGAGGLEVLKASTSKSSTTSPATRSSAAANSFNHNNNSSSSSNNNSSSAHSYSKDPFQDVFDSVINTCNNFINDNNNNNNSFHNKSSSNNGGDLGLVSVGGSTTSVVLQNNNNNRSAANVNAAAGVKGRTRSSNNSNSKIKNILSRQHNSDINNNLTTIGTIVVTSATSNLLTGSPSKLADKTNTTVTMSKLTAISDESIDEDMSYNSSEDDEEKETIQIKKKSRTGDDDSPSKEKGSPKESEESNNQQRLFNKYVRESVERRLGKDFLLLHEIQEIDPEIMEDIKNEAMQSYPPINIRPRRAWHLAKASLRCRRRSLRRQKEKQIKSEDEHSTSATPLQ